MKRICQLLTAGMLVLGTACSHGSSPDQPPPPATDTFTAGWSRVTSMSRFVVNDVFFADQQRGYAAAADTALFRSSDGGNTWTQMPVSFVPPSVRFVNIGARGQKAAFAGFGNYSFNTLTGTSVTATQRTASTGLINFSDVFFAGADTVFFSSLDHAWRSLDGGATVDTVFKFSFSSSSDNSLYFLNGFEGWMLRSDKLYRTQDGGLSWTPGFSSGGNNDGTLQFLNRQVGFISAQGRLYKTTDGGATAVLLRDFNSGTVADMHFFDSQNGYVSAGNRIYKTTDGGATWTTVAALAGSAYFIELHFVDPDHGWASGNGVLLRYQR